MGWLVLASLFFYGWWNPAYVLLIVISVVANFGLAQAIIGSEFRVGRLLLLAGVAANLLILAYFKYAGFFLDNLNVVLGSAISWPEIILPLAISFFTFQQIAYLVDVRRGKAREYDFRHYCLFVTFFPQLIAGPIVHHREMMPQFLRPSNDAGLSLDGIALGVSVFVLGLGKKVLIADSVAPYATTLFNAAEAGATPSFIEAWGGALAYTFQLYFDFSGYSDMAIGLALMFGVRLPLNFNSPYKSVNIIDFWRRWHITLSRFLRDYLYISLGGNRKGSVRRYVNLLLTMLLGGLWHGAGWTFVCWGALHGFYLIINHGWHAIWRNAGAFEILAPGLKMWVSRVITFLAVVVGWVFFRAESFDAAVQVLNGMAGVNGVVLPGYLVTKAPILAEALLALGVEFGRLDLFAGLQQALQLVALLLVVWLAPNVTEIFLRQQPVCDAQSHDLQESRWSGLRWNANVAWAFVVGIVLMVSLTRMTQISEFLYFDF